MPIRKTRLSKIIWFFQYYAMKFNMSWIDFDPNVTFSSFTIIHGTDIDFMFCF